MPWIACADGCVKKAWLYLTYEKNSGSHIILNFRAKIWFFECFFNSSHFCNFNFRAFSIILNFRARNWILTETINSLNFRAKMLGCVKKAGLYLTYEKNSVSQKSINFRAQFTDNFEHSVAKKSLRALRVRKFKSDYWLLYYQFEF